MKKYQLFIKKHSSMILAITSSVGVILTTYNAIVATPKAIKLIEEKENEEGYYLNYREKFLLSFPLYIPTILSGLGTIFCIFGMHYVNKRTQKSIIAAYTVLNSKFMDYKNKLREVGTINGKNFEAEILRSKMGNNVVLDKNKELFFDFNSMQYFQSTMADLKIAENLLNQQIYSDGYATMNDLYDILHIKNVPYGYQMGWSIEHDDKLYGNRGLEFEFEPVTFDDGLECKILTVTFPPSWEYFC